MKYSYQISTCWGGIMTNWQTYAQMAGVGGLLLSIYNFWHGLKKPAREWQRELRQELREILINVDDGCDAARRKFNSIVSDCAPPRSDFLETAMASLSTFMKKGMVSPRQEYLKNMLHILDTTDSRWCSCERDVERQTPGETAWKHRSMLFDSILETSDYARECIGMLNDIDRRTGIPYFVYKHRKP